jgi:hypothetical protein
LEEFAKGVTKGFFEHWEEKLPEWLSRIKNHEIAFLQDKPTYDIAKKESESAEYQLFAQFAPKGWPRILFKVGLAMRKIESEKESVQMTKDDIVKKFGVSELRIAELAQKGILTQLVAQLTKILGNPTDVKKKLMLFLENAGELVVWVKKSDETRVERLCGLIKGWVDNSPSQMSIVLGSGYARDVVWKILRCVKKDVREYYIQVQEEGLQTVGFVFAPELAGKITYWSEPFAKT